MRGYKTLIQEAMLLAMPPMAVADFIKRRADQSEQDSREDPVDEDAEAALLDRKDTVIELALARYGRHMRVVAAIFQAAAPGSIVRLACLSNRTCQSGLFATPFPEGLLGDKPGPTAKWLTSASDDELLALFENPTLSNRFLINLLERRGGYESIDYERLLRCVSILHRNPRMRTPLDDDLADADTDYIYNAVFNAAWELAGTAPVTEGWSYALGRLYDQLVTVAFSINEPLTLAARWHVAPDDAKAIERQAANHSVGYLGDMELVRMGLGRLALKKDYKILPEMLASDDVAFRAAAYSHGLLDTEQLRNAYERDGELAFNQAFSNLKLWRTNVTRRTLNDIAWTVTRNDKHSSLMAAQRYRDREDDLRKRHPAWFTDEEQRDEPSAPATQADLAAISDLVNRQQADLAAISSLIDRQRADFTTISSIMDRQSKGLEAVGQALQALMSRASWILWLSLGALVASLRHF